MLQSEYIIRKKGFNNIIKHIFLTQIYLCIQKSWKRRFKTGYCVQNHILNLCFSVMNSQRLPIIMLLTLLVDYN